MPYYRLYFLDRTGQIQSFSEFEEETDDSALAYAERCNGHLAMELWRGHEKLARLDTADPARIIVNRWRERRRITGLAGPEDIEPLPPLQSSP